MTHATNAEHVSRAEFDDLIERLSVIKNNAIAQSERLTKLEEKTIARLTKLEEKTIALEDAFTSKKKHTEQP